MTPEKQHDGLAAIVERMRVVAASSATTAAAMRMMATQLGASGQAMESAQRAAATRRIAEMCGRRPDAMVRLAEYLYRTSLPMRHEAAHRLVREAMAERPGRR